MDQSLGQINKTGMSNMSTDFENHSEYSFYNIVNLAEEILRMTSEIRILRRENERLREIEKKYLQLSKDSLDSSMKMAGTMLKIFTTPGVATAFRENASSEDFK